MNSIYGDIEEVLSSDLSTPLGKRIQTFSFINANLYHDFVTECAMAFHYFSF